MLSVEFKINSFSNMFQDFAFGVSSGSSKNKNLKDYKRETLRVVESKAGLTVTRSHKIGTKDYVDKKGNKVTAKESFESVLENSPQFEKFLQNTLDDDIYRIAAGSSENVKELTNLARNLGRKIYVQNANKGAPAKIRFENGVVKYPTIRTGETLDAIEGGVYIKDGLGLG